MGMKMAKFSGFRSRDFLGIWVSGAKLVPKSWKLPKCVGCGSCRRLQFLASKWNLLLGAMRNV